MALLFIAAAFYSATIEKDLQLFKAENQYWLAAAVLGQLCTYLLSALIYRALLQLFHEGHQLTTGELFRLTIIAFFLNQIIPSGGGSGNTYMLHILPKRHVPASKAISLIIIELLTFYVAIELVIVFLLLMGVSFLRLPYSMLTVLATGLVVYLIFAFAVMLASSRHAMGALFKKITAWPLFQKLIKKVRISWLSAEALKDVESPQNFFLRNGSRLVYPVLCQTGILLADAFTIYALFRGLGVSMPFLLVMAGFILTGIVALLPVSPGALIPYESSMTIFYVTFGAPLSAAVIATLLFRVLSFWLPLPFGFFIYRKMQMKQHEPANH